MTAEDGSYRRPGLPEGSYRVEAVTPSIGFARIKDVRVQTGAEAWVPLALERGVDVSVRVVGPDGKDATAVRVRLVGPAGEVIQSEGRLLQLVQNWWQGGEDERRHTFREVPRGRWTVEVLRDEESLHRRPIAVGVAVEELLIRLDRQERK